MKFFNYLTLFVFIFISSVSFSQRYTISGYVKDTHNSEDLIGVNIFIDSVKVGTTTNSYGFYTISLPASKYTITYSFVGYQSITKVINLKSNHTENVFLESSAIVKDEIVVLGDKKANIESTKMSVIKLPIETIKSIPAFMGEIDPLKTIQLLPGIQSAGEGNSSFYVRGGGPDQNLILLDEAVVYNAAHLFGFFSIFNSDALKDMELYKGSMPAEYGGRLSSVLDISMKNGNMKWHEINGGIGTISSRITIQGPIIKDTCSYLISARRTYLDFIIKPFINKDSPYKNSGYFFYDLNAKLNYKFSDKDRLYFSFYYGKDVFDFVSTKPKFNMSVPWGNLTSSLRWNHLISSKFFMNTSFIISNYKFKTQIELTRSNSSNTGVLFTQNSGIRDYHFKQDYTFIPNHQHTMKFGLNYTYHVFTPNTVSAALGDIKFNYAEVPSQLAHEFAFYLGDDFKISDKFSIYLGLRDAVFLQVGPFTRYIKDENRTITVDSIEYGKNEKVVLYNSFEPRVNLKFAINSKSSLKFSFMQNKQFVHLVSLSSTTLPTDLWVPCSDYVKPQIGRQYSLGYFRNFFNDHFETSIETYYKKLWNLLEYADGALPGDDVSDNADNYLIFGNGESYGIEFFIKKQTGRLTGWIGYTLSKTDRSFKDIDNGEKFPAKYDRRHDISLTASYQLTDKWSFSTVFVFATGNTTSLPISRYMIDGDLSSEYSKRNSYRMPAYHRLDLSVNYEHKIKKKWKSVWNFSVYNVYNRKNPYFIFFVTEGSVNDGTYNTSAKQVSLFPILPAITWNFNF